MKTYKYQFFVLLYLNFIILSLSFVVANFAGQHELFSLKALSLYSISFLLLGVYAIGWQQILKRIPLSVAIANRPMTTLTGIIWGVFLFSEDVSVRQIIGIFIVFVGVALVVMNNE